MEILYKPIFIKEFNKLNNDLQEEVLEKIELFKDVSNHKNLKVHKLNGKYNEFYAFSVNYDYRIIFEYKTKNEIHFLDVGNHDIYK
jgi:addiction module RelE/StbE family toxin